MVHHWVFLSIQVLKTTVRSKAAGFTVRIIYQYSSRVRMEPEERRLWSLSPTLLPWFLDDVVLAGKKASVLRAFPILESIIGYFCQFKYIRPLLGQKQLASLLGLFINTVVESVWSLRKGGFGVYLPPCFHGSWMMWYWLVRRHQYCGLSQS